MIGCLTQGADIWLGGSGIDLHNMRIPGILQRIAFAYCIVAMMKLFLPVWTVVCGRVQGAVHRLF